MKGCTRPLQECSLHAQRILGKGAKWCTTLVAATKYVKLLWPGRAGMLSVQDHGLVDLSSRQIQQLPSFHVQKACQCTLRNHVWLDFLLPIDYTIAICHFCFGVLKRTWQTLVKQ